MSQQPLYDDPASLPLFGETTPRDRVINLVVGGITVLIVLVTLVSAFVVKLPPNGANIYFAVCILFLLATHIILVYWYRQGDLEPKFRTLIYYNTFALVLLCVCANLFFHRVIKQ